MSNNRRGARFWINTWLPVLLAILMIVIESTEWMGADHTSGPLRTIWQAIFGHVSERQWQIIHHYLRKTGHFIGYGFVGLTWLRAWWMTLPKSHFLTDTLLALLGTTLIAASDEFHQSFVPNRTASPWDVLIDCSGAATLQLVVYLFMRINRPKQLARAA
jgi:VanZ family protein